MNIDRKIRVLEKTEGLRLLKAKLFEKKRIKRYRRMWVISV